MTKEKDQGMIVIIRAMAMCLRCRHSYLFETEYKTIPDFERMLLIAGWKKTGWCCPKWICPDCNPSKNQ